MYDTRERDFMKKVSFESLLCDLNIFFTSFFQKMDSLSKAKGNEEIEKISLINSRKRERFAECLFFKFIKHIFFP